MNTFRRAAAEFIGTCVLVVVGCGTAMTVGCSGTGYLLTALAFGLGLLTMAYSIGNISGCHINPALSFAMLILGKMSYKDFFAYAAFVNRQIGAPAFCPPPPVRLIIRHSVSYYLQCAALFAPVSTSGVYSMRALFSK